MTRKPEDSTALREQREEYPAGWEGKVPRTVQIVKIGDGVLPFITLPEPGTIVEVYVNMHGALSAILDQKGESLLLGLKPGEFEIVTWHGEENVK